MRYALALLLALAPACVPATSPPVDDGDAGGGGDPVECCFPSATYDTNEAPCGGYDWTCDGIEEPEIADIVDCASVPYDDCGGPDDRDGWLDEVPACGETGAYVTGCVRETTSQTCIPADVSDRVQACR